jgi:hypothetical protein
MLETYKPEFIYDGFEVDEKPLEWFSARIQDEVKHVGGCVIGSFWDGPPDIGMAKIIVAFEHRHNLAAYIRMYYTQGQLDPEDIDREIASIKET